MVRTSLYALCVLLVGSALITGEPATAAIGPFVDRTEEVKKYEADLARAVSLIRDEWEQQGEVSNEAIETLNALYEENSHWYRNHGPTRLAWGLLWIPADADLRIGKASRPYSDRVSQAGVVLLHLAARQGDLGAVQHEIIDRGMDINAADCHGWTALHWAIVGGQIDAVEYLLDHGASAGAASPGSPTPLHIAALYGHTRDLNRLDRVQYQLTPGRGYPGQNHDLDDQLDQERAAVAQWLLAAGADAGAETANKETPLHFAAACGSERLVQLLLDAGAEVRATDGKGNRPLHLAAGSGQLEAVETLIEAGADPTPLNAHDETPRHCALDNQFPQQGSYEFRPSLFRRDGCRGIAESLWKYVDQDSIAPLEHYHYRGLVERGMDEETAAFLQSVWYDDAQMTGLLLKNGLDVNSFPEQHETPLHVAAMYGHSAVAPLLIAAGADVNATDTRDDHSPLYKAVWNSNTAVARCLLDAGADPNEGVGAWSELLWIASAACSPEMVRLLLEYGAFLRPVDDMEDSPLKIAAKHGCVETVEALLAGLPPVVDWREEFGATLFCLAAACDAPELLIWVLDQELDEEMRIEYVDAALHRAMGPYRTENARLLIEAGADVDFKGESGRTPLSVAADCNSVETILLLLDAGADVNAAMSNGRTAIFRAAIYGHEEVIEILIEAGADVNAVDVFGQTALHQAAEDGAAECVLLLLDSDALPNVADRHGQTPRDLARENERRDVLRLMERLPSTPDDSRGLVLYPSHYWGSLSWVEELIDSGADVNAPIGREEPPLYWVMWDLNRREWEEPVRLLLAAGADPNSCEITFGNSPLHYATLHGEIEIAKMLIAAGADLTALNRDGFTPLAVATSAEVAELLIDAGSDIECTRVEGAKAPVHSRMVLKYPAVLEVLIEAGVDVNRRDENNDTPLHYAACYGYTDAIDLLVEAGADPSAVDNQGRTPRDVAIVWSEWHTANSLWAIIHGCE